MGKLITNLNEILNNDKIVCCEYKCRSGNIELKSKTENSQGDETYKNYEFFCKECDTSFMYSSEKGSHESNKIDELIK